MSDYAYKPRLGFDIRVRPPETEEVPVWTEPTTRACDAPGCGHRAAVRVSKSPRHPADKIWLCSAHAQEHNRRWDFFDGLSDREAEAIRVASQYGDRPTWAMGKNARARAGQKFRGPADFFDAFGLFGDPARRNPLQGRMREGRVLSKLQAQAFETLGLQPTAKGPDIRRRYAELLRQYHPDANGGDRSAESQLIAVVKAHQILKKAGIC
ncbi:MAG: DnaJ domain-containing protein [Parvularculaceae bacterium]|jgi:DnaJ-domain-containing protein 1|nr:DnaJ domain-containing protein [Parvularculaceae bacterium]